MSDDSQPSGSATDLKSVQAGHWELDATKSSVGIRHKTIWGLVTVKGTFTTVRGEGDVSEQGAGHGTLTIDAASVDTKNAKRDTHLRSADFFDIDAHPSIVFTANSVTPNAHDTVDVVGELTVRGASRPLVLAARATEAGADAVTLSGEIEVDEREFGLVWNQLGMIKGKTTVTLSVRFTHRQGN